MRHLPRLLAATAASADPALPRPVLQLRFLGIDAFQWMGLALAALAGAAVAFGLDAAIAALKRRLARRRGSAAGERTTEELRAPLRLLVATGVFGLIERGLDLSATPQVNVEHAMRIATVVAFAWAALRGLRSAGDLVSTRAVQAGDEAAARARVTRVMVLRHILEQVVVVAASSVILLQFDAFRALGTSLLASAGIAGLVFGLAAQRSLASVFAGIQLSLTQPIRAGDVVTIDGETGTIEEITLTYVVVKIWDLRRLIVPITKFLDSSFENWTRTGTSLMGTVVVHADYAAPVEALRKELAAYVATRAEWDGKVATLEVSGATERTIELTAVVSSADSARSAALRSAVRERLVGVLQALDGGRYLPHTRLVMPAVDAGATSADGARAAARARTRRREE